MTNVIPKIKTCENTCLNIEVGLRMDGSEGEDNAEDAPKELLDLLDEHESRFQLNVD